MEHSSIRQIVLTFHLLLHLNGRFSRLIYRRFYNVTRLAPIANPPNSAQLGGISYHSLKLHPGWCSSMGMRPRTDGHTDTQTRVTTVHFAPSTTHTKCIANNSAAARELNFQVYVFMCENKDDGSVISERKTLMPHALWFSVSDFIFNHRCSAAKRGGCFQRRLFVCQFVRTITSE